MVMIVWFWKISEDFKKIITASNSSNSHATDETYKEKYITGIITGALASLNEAEKSNILNAIKKLW